MKKPTKLTRKERALIQSALRYYDAKQIAKEFKRPAERRAIAAVFRWLGLNGTCAWFVGPDRLAQDVASKAVKHKRDKPYDAVVLQREKLKYAEELLLGKS